MYQSEKVFIKKFLACLSKMGIKEIPYDNNAFYSGVEYMEQYYNSIKDNLGKNKDELGMLFIKRPIEGTFIEFKGGISKQNGRLMSFVNPDYVRAIIKIDGEGAEFILDQDKFDFDDSYLYDFAREFCRGANLAV